MKSVQQYIETDYPVFDASETVSDVVLQLKESGLQEAPVVKNGKLLALVSVEELLEPDICLPEAKEETDAHLRLENIQCNEPLSAREEEHLLDIFDRLNDDRSATLLPVVDGEGMYRGVLVKSRLFLEIAELFHFSEKGSTLEIEVPALGVKLSDVIDVLEKNDAMVLSFGVVEPEPGAQTMVLALRIQCKDMYRLVKNLEKYGYLVSCSMAGGNEGGVDELREKALEFMRYIDM